MAIADDGMLLGLALREWIADVAGQAGIPLQPYVAKGINTDGRAIQQHGGGIPVMSLATPMRYAHCHSGIVKRSDYNHMLRLLGLLVEGLDAKTVGALTDWPRLCKGPRP